jgi:hypothetical protein
VFGLAGQVLATRWTGLTTGFPTIFSPALLLAGLTLAGVAVIALVLLLQPIVVVGHKPIVVDCGDAWGEFFMGADPLPAGAGSVLLDGCRSQLADRADGPPAVVRASAAGAADGRRVARHGSDRLAASARGRRRRLVVRLDRRADAVVTLSQLPVGPSVGAAAAVLILGSDGVAASAAAGVLLTVTGTIGGLCFLAWAGADGLWVASRRGRARHARRQRSG